MISILKVTFPPTVGYQSGKVYSYVTEQPVDGVSHAIVRDPRGDMVLTKVVGVEPYTRQPFRMKHAVKLLYKQEILQHLALKGL